jgi:4-hydroxy-tetrahydrodipicolinate reductase
MNLALIGFGAMGQLIAQLSSSEGHGIGRTFTSRDSPQSVEELAAALRGHDVALDFSAAGAVARNVEACALAAVPLVEGTTGWNSQAEPIKALVAKHDGSLVYGANFSLGVNLFYRIAAHAASLFQSVKGYDSFIEEAHHARKRDAPSGTALRLRELLSARLDKEIPITSTRAGYIPGTHRIGFDSAADQITLTHAARSREGFAAGALVAANWIRGHKGVFEFSEVIDEILQPDRKRNSK